MASMARKRAADELDAPTTSVPRDDCKRAKISPTDTARGNSSVLSSCSVSEASALQSSPRASERAQRSSFSSFGSLEPELDDGQSTSSTSSDDSSLAESEDEITTIGGPKKPKIHTTALLSGAQDLQARLVALLPQLAAGSGDLHNLGTIEDVDDDEQHIEMNLELGVLEEKRTEIDDSSSDTSTEDSEDSEQERSSSFVSSGVVQRKPGLKGTGVMDKLFGHDTSRSRPEIEELG